MSDTYRMHAKKDISWEEVTNYLEQVLENVSQDRIVSVSHATYPGARFGGPFWHSVIIIVRQSN